MKGQSWALILFVSATVMASGCGLMMHEAYLAGLDKAVGTKPIEKAELDTGLRPGVTTKQEVEQRFGKPNSRQHSSNGEEVWIYSRGNIGSWMPSIPRGARC